MKTQNVLIKAFFACLGLGVVVACGSSGGGGSSAAATTTGYYSLNNGQCTNSAGQIVDINVCNGQTYLMENGICVNRTNNTQAPGMCGTLGTTGGTCYINGQLVQSTLCSTNGTVGTSTCYINGQLVQSTLCGTNGTTTTYNPYQSGYNPYQSGYNPYGGGASSRCQYYYNPYYGTYSYYCM